MAKSKATWGVERPRDKDKTDGDTRDPFEIDADRIFYSPEFRRLAGVTQVVSPQEDYVYHDRLTHSIKVAQIARSIAKSTNGRAASNVPEEERASPGACYVAGLAHDLGHPPFGHAAEDELQRLLGPQDRGSAKHVPLLGDSFEGNAQSFRIVARLSFRKPYVEQQGLNLSWRSLAAISKYPWLKGKHGTQHSKLDRKWGFYDSEEPYLLEMTRLGLLPPSSPQLLMRQALDGQIMDWADDIAYAVHDIEDSFRAARIPLHAFSKARRPSDGFLSDDSQFMDFARERCLAIADEGYAVTEKDFAETIEGLGNLLPDSPFNGSRQAHIDLQRFASDMITQLIDGCELQSVGGAQRLVIDPSVKLLAELLKSFAKYFTIKDPVLESAQIGQRRAIRQLFEILAAWSFDVMGERPFQDVDGKRLPPRLREYLELALSDDAFTGYSERDVDHRVHRAVVDYLCSLTDKQAALLHQRLTGDSVGRLSPFWLSA